LIAQGLGTDIDATRGFAFVLGAPTADRRRPAARPVSDAVHAVVIPGYTFEVKTAISVPDDTFNRASARAHDLGMSRSEFFATAARHYLDELDAESIIHQIDAAVARLEATDQSTADAVSAGHRVLADVDEEW